MSLSVWLTLYIVGIVVHFKHRKSILFASILAMPQSLYGLLVVPVYWQPERILIFGIGLEDALFSFLTGGLAWIVVLTFLKDPVLPDFIWQKLIFRFFLCILFGFIVAPVLYHCGIRDMVNPFITMIIWTLVIVAFDRKYLKLTAIGAFSFLLVYGIGFKFQILFWPSYFSFWNWENMWGLKFMEIPLEELVWAFLYGGSWSLTVAFILNIGWKKTEPGV